MSESLSLRRLCFLDAGGQQRPWLAESSAEAAPWGLGCRLCAAAAEAHEAEAEERGEAGGKRRAGGKCREKPGRSNPACQLFWVSSTLCVGLFVIVCVGECCGKHRFGLQNYVTSLGFAVWGTSRKGCDTWSHLSPLGLPHFREVGLSDHSCKALN